MPVTARSMRNRFAWGIQASEGTPMVTNASLYEVSMYGGGLHPQSDEVPFAMSDAQDVAENFYMRRFDWMADTEIAVDVDSIGSLFKAHLGTDTPSGAGPYTHVITKSTPPWVTMFEMKPGPSGGTDYWVQGSDGFVRGISVTFSAGETGHATLDVLGKKSVFNQTTPPAATRDIRIATTSPTGSIATMINSTLNIGAGTIHNLETVTITSNYSTGDLLQTDASTPDYVQYGLYTTGFTATAILTAAEFALLAGTFYGSSTITADMGFPVNPSSVATVAPSFTFNTIGGTASRSVAFAFGAQRVRIPEFATVDPAGTAIRVTITGQTAYNANPLTVTAINNRATY